MKSILKNVVLAAVAATSCVAAAAVDGYVSKSLSDTAKQSGGEWTAAATWNPSGEPQENARITLFPNADANPTLTIGSDIVKEYRLLFFQNNTASSSVTIDGEGHRLLMPYSAAGYYENAAFNVYAPDGNRYFFKGGTDSTGKAPVLEWTNPLVTVGVDAEKCGYVDFKRGVFNFRDPGGIVGRAVEIANYYSGTKPMTVRVRKDAELRLGATTYYAGTDGDEILFDGGKGVLGDVTVSYASAASSARDVYFTLTNGATVAMDSLTETLEGSASSSVCFNLRVTGSALSVTNGDFKIAPVSGGRAVVSFDDSAFDVSNGNPDVGKGTTALYEDTEMNVAGKNFVRKGANVTYRNCTGSLGCQFIATDNAIWSFNDPAVVTVDGGAVTFNGSEEDSGVGSRSDNANTEDFGRLVVTNGAMVTVTGAKRFELGSRYATGELLVCDGEFKTTRNELCVGGWGGSGPLGRGLLRIFDGGKVTVGATLSVGRYCTPSTLHVNGGVLSVAGSMIFDNNTFRTRVAAVTNLYLQTAGLATIASGIKMSEGGCDSEMRLEGGVTEAPCIGPGTKALDGTATATLIGDGGTLRMGDAYAVPYITGLSSVKAGAKGLTIDTNGKTSSIEQDIANLDDVDGVFAVKGGGTLTLAPQTGWTVTTTRIDGSTVRFPDGATTLATDLMLDNGAILSLEGGATTLTLSALSVSGGTICLDPGDIIRLPAAELELHDFEVEYTSEPEVDAANVLFELTGDLSEENRAAIVRAIDRVRGTDTYMQVVVETSEGVMRVKTVKKNRASALTDETAWRGATSDGWATDTNWSANAPTAGKVAVFSGAGAKTVVVSENAVAGALRFDADGYTLTGDAILDLPADEGAARIETTVGKAEIAAPLKLVGRVDAVTAPGTELTVSGDIAGGGFAKAGTGRLNLSGENAFERAVSFGGGYGCIGSAAAVGDADTIVELAGDTLWVTNETGATVTLANPVIVKTPTLLRNTSIRNDVDLTLKNLRVEQGGLAKWGSGKLTIEVNDGMELAPSARSTGRAWVWAADFGEDGTVPDNRSAAESGFVGAFAIGSGEVVFKSAAGKTKQTVMFSKDSLQVGMQVKDRGVAKCTFDGVRVMSGSIIACGYSLSSTGGITPNFRPELRFVNGAEANVAVFEVANSIYYAKNYPLLAVTNSSVTARTLFVFSGRTGVGYADQSPDAAAVVRTDGATFLSDDYCIGQGVDAKISNSLLGPRTKDYAKLWARWAANDTVATHGTLLFDRGSVMKVNAFESFNLVTNWYGQADEPCFALAFDDARWDYGTGDYTLAANTFSKYVRVQMNGKGVRLCPPAGTVFTTEFPFTGEGGLVVDGEGTVRFAANTLKFTGTVDVRSGTLDLTSAGSLKAVPLMGSGTVRGGSFANVMLKAGSALTFDGTSFGSRLTIDFGRTEADPMDPAVLANGVEIGSFIGTMPVLPTDVRGINTGFGKVRGTVRVVGNKLVASLSRPGFALSVR